MHVPTPEFLKRTAAVGQFVGMPLIKAVDFAIDFVPYVGQAKMLLEAISGRSLPGQLQRRIETGRGWDELPQDLEMEDRIIRILPLAVSVAVKIGQKALGWIEALSRMKQLTGLGDDVLKARLADMASLQGRERELIQGLLKLREARRAAVQGLREAAVAPAYMMMGVGGLGGIPGKTARRARQGVELVLEIEPGMVANDVRRKAAALDSIVKQRNVTKPSGTVGPRKVVTGGVGEYYRRGKPVQVPAEYKYRILDRAHRQFGPQSGNYDSERWSLFFELWKKKSGDHVLDLQLGGLDDVSNIWLLDLATNTGLGNQIYQQLRRLPPGTRITGVRVK